MAAPGSAGSDTAPALDAAARQLSPSAAPSLLDCAAGGAPGQASSKRRIYKNPCRDLRRAVEETQQQLERLQVENERLRLQHNLLVSLCDVLQALRAARNDDGDDRASLAVCAEELLLLQELSGISYSDTGGAARDAPSLPPVDTSCPDAPCASDDDPLLLQRWLVAQPLHPLSIGMELPGLLAQCASSITQLALQLAKVDVWDFSSTGEQGTDAACSPCSTAEAAEGAGSCYSGGADCLMQLPASPAPTQPLEEVHPLQAIQAIQADWLTLCSSLVLQGKWDLMWRLATTNHFTGEPGQVCSPAFHRRVLQQLRLSPAQLRRLSAGMAVLERLQAPLRAEQQRLQAVVQQTAPAPRGEQAASSSEASALQQLEEHQQAVDSLHRAIRKAVMIDAAAMTFLWGALSWRQTALARVLFSPLTMEAGMMASLAARLGAEQAQQQQQAQQKPGPRTPSKTVRARQQA